MVVRRRRFVGAERVRPRRAVHHLPLRAYEHAGIAEALGLGLVARGLSERAERGDRHGRAVEHERRNGRIEARALVRQPVVAADARGAAGDGDHPGGHLDGCAYYRRGLVPRRPIGLPTSGDREGEQDYGEATTHQS